MNSLIISTIILLALLTATALASLYFQRREKVRLLEEIERLRDEKNASDAARTEAETEIRRRMDEHARTTAELAAVKAATETELAALRRKTEEQRETEQQERKKAEETLCLQFRNLANEIFGEQSQRFRETNKDALDLLLKPFRDNITDFRKRVEEIYTTQTSQRGELKAELKNLMELNRRITTETTNLTNALKGNSKV